MSEQISNIGKTVVDHCWSFKTETPSDDADIFRETHRAEHLRSENTGVSNFNPTLQLRMETKDFKTGLGIRVISRLILDLVNADLCIEFFHDTQEVAKSDISISNETFDLMELSQMSGIKGLVTEDTIDREIFHGLEAFLTLALLCKLIKHLRGDSRSVSTKQIFLCLIHIPIVVITK